MRIDPKQHNWMTAPETVAVMNALVEARFVAAPTQRLLGALVADVDIAVPMPPAEAVTRLLRRGSGPCHRYRTRHRHRVTAIAPSSDVLAPRCRD